MVIRKKAVRKTEDNVSSTVFNESKVNEIINRGGKTTGENVESGSETRFTLRIPQKMIDEIDILRKDRAGNVSRNQWIVEAIAEKISPKRTVK